MLFSPFAAQPRQPCRGDGNGRPLILVLVLLFPRPHRAPCSEFSVSLALGTRDCCGKCEQATDFHNVVNMKLSDLLTVPRPPARPRRPTGRLRCWSSTKCEATVYATNAGTAIRRLWARRTPGSTPSQTKLMTSTSSGVIGQAHAFHAQATRQKHHKPSSIRHHHR